jgi:hypothetical protein
MRIWYAAKRWFSTARYVRAIRTGLFVVSFHLRTWLVQRQQTPITGNTPLTDVRTLVFFAAICIYVSGWSFDYDYLRNFGIPLASLNVEYYSFLVYSYGVITSPLGAATFILGFLGVAFFNHAIRSRLMVAFILCIMIPCFFGIGRRMGTHTAELVRSRDDGQRISFVFKPGNVYPSDIMALNDNHMLRILSQTKERYIVFYQPPAADGIMPRAEVLQIAATDVLLATTTIPDIERR